MNIDNEVKDTKWETDCETVVNLLKDGGLNAWAVRINKRFKSTRLRINYQTKTIQVAEYAVDDIVPIVKHAIKYIKEKKLE